MRGVIKMKKVSKALAALVSAAAVMASSVGSALPAVTSPTVSSVAVDDCNDDWLHAEGSKLYDASGNQVWITGANWFGFNCSENCPHGLYARDVDDMLQSIADHGINTLRLPISSELLVSWMNGKPDKVSSIQASYTPPVDEVGEDGKVTPAGYYTNINKDFVESDGKTVKNSMEIFDIIMQKCKKYGIKVFIDIHSPDANNSGHNYELWYGLAGISTDKWIDSLTWLAEKYSSDDTLIGYDLKNEPHGKRGYTGDKCPDTIAKWDGSKDENNWAYAAKKCADSILAVNPHALIFIEGVEQYPKTEDGNTYDTPDIWDAPADKSPWYGAWWGGNLRGVKDFPVLPESGTSQIVYSPHDYGPSVYAQTWFDKDFTEQTLLDDYWYDTWAYINDQDIAPLLIGEWGGHMDKGANQKWMELLRDYMVKNHINHTFWCINPNSGDTGGLLDATYLNWDDNKYSLFEKSLWQTSSSGKYIGLDHQVALGVNGLSLNDYYGKYAASEGSNINGGTKGSGQTISVETTTPKTTTTTAPKTTTTTTGQSTTTTTATTTQTTTTQTVADTTTTTHPSTRIKADGNISIEKPPTKVTYNIGEELDLTGGTASASGVSEEGAMWDIFSQPLDSQCFIVDSSKFDNTKAGTYKIYVSPKTYPVAMASFTVTVVEGSGTTTCNTGASGTGQNTEDTVSYGDANIDGKVSVADAVTILQYIANKDKYELKGQGRDNADCCNPGDGITAMDALAIQKYDAKAITKLPEIE